MITMDMQDLSSKRTNASGRNTPDKRASRRPARPAGEIRESRSSAFGEDIYDSIGHAFSEPADDVKNGVSKWNYAEKEGENGKNSLRNPLIFHEIPRNYGCQRIKFFVRYGKSGHLSIKEGAQLAAIRTSQVVDFWRNLAYSHIKTAGGGIYDGLTGWEGSLMGRVNGLNDENHQSLQGC